MRTVTIEFVGGPSDGEVRMLAEAVKEVHLRLEPKWSARRRSEVLEVVYRRRDGPPRPDGVLFYDYAH